MKAPLLGLPLSLLLAGCVPYPVHKTLQPTAQIEVLDARGRPLADAEVTLTAYNRFGQGEVGRAQARTDAQGLARFERRGEWRVETTMLHGSAEYLWSWCIYRPGFVTWQSRPQGDDFRREHSVRLLPGASRPCPPPPGE